MNKIFKFNLLLAISLIAVTSNKTFAAETFEEMERKMKSRRENKEIIEIMDQLQIDYINATKPNASQADKEKLLESVKKAKAILEDPATDKSKGFGFALKSMVGKVEMTQGLSPD